MQGNDLCGRDGMATRSEVIAYTCVGAASEIEAF